MAGRGAAPPAGTTAAYFPGLNTDYAETPDTAANSITGDIDVRVRCSPDSWSAFNLLAAKFGSASQWGWVFMTSANVAGDLGVFYSTTGSNFLDAYSSTTTGFAAGSDHWVRFTKSGTQLKFWTSDDGTSWTQLGTTQTVTAGLFDNNTPIRLGGYASAQLTGELFKFELRNGIGGTLVNSFDATAVTKLGTRNPSSVVASTGETWTLSGSAWDWVAV